MDKLTEKQQVLVSSLGYKKEDVLKMTKEEIDEILDEECLLHEGHLVGDCYECKDGI